MKQSRLLGAATGCACLLISTWLHASTISVSDVFRYIRTDVYAESGGNIDQGTQTIDGPSTPLTPEGTFSSTRQADATISSGSGSATSQSRVVVDSLYEVFADSLVFNVAAALSLDTDTSGDGLIQNPSPNPNCCRSFSYLYHYVVFDITEKYTYSISGSGSPSAVSLYNIGTASTIATGPSSGVLQPGSYRYGLTSSLETRGSNAVNYSQSYDIQFLATAAVPIPAAIWLFGSGLFGLVGVARRKHIT